MSRIQGIWSTVASVVGRILDVGPFWWVWLTAAVGTTVTLRLLGGVFAPATGFAAVPFFVVGIGVISVVYSLLLEFWPRRGTTVPPTIDCLPVTSPTARPRGESMIPGAAGLALIVFSIFLHLSITRRELTILVVGLPLVLVFAPTFVLFAYGYWRGEPTIGAFGYRAMPLGFAVFVALAAAVLLGRRFGVPMAGDGLAFPLAIGAIVGLLCLASFYRAWRRSSGSDG